jgi:hypothetical protein
MRAVQLVLGRADAGVVRAGEADAGHPLQRLIQHRAAFLLGRLRQDFFHQPLGGIDQHAGRVAVGVAHDLAAGRIRGLVGDAGQRQRAGVGPAGVAVDALEPGRAIGDDAVEFLRGREAAQLPVLLVPAAPAHPRAARVRARVGLDPLQGLRQRGGAGQVELGQHLAQAEHVAVGVDQAGQHGAAMHVDVARVRRLACHVPGRADRHDPALVIEGQRSELDHVAFRVERVAVGVVDDGVGVGAGATGAQGDQGTLQGKLAQAHRGLHSC